MRFGVAVAALAVVVAGCGDQSPASLVFVGFEPEQPKIGDIVTVRFAAVDSRGVPAEGIPVSFALQSPSNAPDVKLQPEVSSTNKGSGEVTTQIIASARPASVVVVATSGDKVAQSPAISIAGSFVSSRGITFQCGHIAGSAAAIHAIIGYGPGRDLIAGTTVDCTAHVADRNGNGIAGASVTFLTEAGAIGPSATSITDAIGNADVLHKTAYPLPQDVDPVSYRHINPDPRAPDYDAVHIPQPAAPDWMLPWEWRPNPMAQNAPDDPKCSASGGCGEPRRADPVRPGRTNNPRDNLVSMIAVTTGEEAYLDLNNNGVRDDPVEPYVDTVEPFVDANDNGTYDSGELFVDTNGDSVWNGKNNLYDSSTLIWAQERILWTGMPNRYDYQEGAPSPQPSTSLAPYIPTVIQVSPLPGAPSLNLIHHGRVAVTYRISDPWFNVFAQNDDSDGCSAEASEVVKVFPTVFGDQGIRVAYPPVVDVTFFVEDAHGEDPPGVPPVLYNPPAPWTVYPSCKTHSTRTNSFEVDIGMQAVSGTVQ